MAHKFCDIYINPFIYLKSVIHTRYLNYTYTIANNMPEITTILYTLLSSELQSLIYEGRPQLQHAVFPEVF